jgi:hypothetical protein
VRLCAPAAEVAGMPDVHSLYLGDSRDTTAPREKAA